MYQNWGTQAYDSGAFGRGSNRCYGNVVKGSALMKLSTGLRLEPRLSIPHLQLGMPRFQLENEGTHNVLLDLPIIEHTIRLGLDRLLLHMQGVVYILLHVLAMYSEQRQEH